MLSRRSSGEGVFSLTDTSRLRRTESLRHPITEDSIAAEARAIRIWNPAAAVAPIVAVVRKHRTRPPCRRVVFAHTRHPNASLIALATDFGGSDDLAIRVESSTVAVAVSECAILAGRTSPPIWCSPNHASRVRVAVGIVQRAVTVCSSRKCEGSWRTVGFPPRSPQPSFAANQQEPQVQFLISVVSVCFFQFLLRCCWLFSNANRDRAHRDRMQRE